VCRQVPFFGYVSSISVTSFMEKFQMDGAWMTAFHIWLDDAVEIEGNPIHYIFLICFMDI
jgi:hypothetical protein